MDSLLQSPPSNVARAEWLAGGGQLGELIRAADWSRSPLGPLTQWPQSLRTAVGLCLSSSSPGLVAWGPHSIQIYNDAFRPLLQDVHPGSLGQSFGKCFGLRSPQLVQGVDRAGEGLPVVIENLELFVDRQGFLEEASFAVACSPIRVESGSVGGVFLTAHETTRQMLLERRLRLLQALDGVAEDVTSLDAACSMVMGVLAAHGEDVPFARLYLLDGEGGRARLAGSAGADEPAHSSGDSRVLKSLAQAALAEAAYVADIVEVDDVDQRFGELSCNPFPEPPRSAFVLPIMTSGQRQPLALLVAGASPRCEVDDAYRSFFRMLRDAVTKELSRVSHGLLAERLKSDVRSELHETEQRYRHIVNGLPAAVYITDTEGRITLFNEAAVDLWKRTPETNKSQWCGSWRIYRPDGTPLPLDQCPMAVCLREGRAVRGEEIIIERPDGSRRNVIPFPQPLLDDAGRIIGALNMLLDITDRKQAELALRESEERFASFMQHLPGLAWIKDAEGRYVFANAAAEKAFQATWDEIQGSTDDELFPPEVARRFQENDHKAVAANAGIQEIETLQHDDGQLHYSIVSKFPIPSTNGRPHHIGGMAIDITQRIEAEAAVQESEHRFRTMANVTPAMVWTAAPDGTITWASDRWFDYMGISRSENARNWPQVLHPDDVQPCLDAWNKAIAAGTEYEVEVRNRRHDGEYRWFVTRATPIRDEAGNIVEWYGSTTDIHDQKQADEDRAFLANIVQSTQDAVVSKTLEGIIKSWNQGAEKVFGYTSEEAVGQSINLIIPPELRDEERTILDRLRRGERIEHFETVRVRKDGRRIDISLTISPIRDREGRVIGASKVARDVSQRKAAERALLESEQRFRRLANAAPVLIWISGTDKQHTWFNEPWLGFVGRTLQEEIGQGWIEHLHPDDAERYRIAYAEAFDARRKFSMEYRLRRHDGVYRWVLDHGVPLISDNGEFRGYIGSCIDISERRQAEAALRAKESELDLVTNTTPLILARCSRDQRYLYLNRAAAAYFGRSPDELIGKRISDTMGPEGYAIVKPRIEQVLRGEKVEYEAEIPYAVLGKRWLHICYSPNLNEDDEVIGWVASIVDITDRKLAEAAKLEIEARFRMLADNIAQLAWICDHLGEAVWYNKRWYDYTGTTFEEMAGWGWKAVQHPDHLDRVVQRLQSCFDSGEPWEDTFPLRGRDGEYRWFLSRALPIRDAAGRIVRWFGTNTDVTEQLRAEEALREADRRKDEFLAMLAHELRNPLAPIRTGLELMKLVKDDVRQIEQTRAMMERQTRQLIALVDDLLDVSRITRGKLELRKSRILLEDAVRSAIEASRSFIDEAGHQLSVQMPDRQLHVNADPHRLAQILSNLLNNAAKYTPPGGRILLVIEPQGSDVVLSVCDNGIGIPADQLEGIFEMFAQIKRPQEHGYTGLGIGLTLVKSLVGMHGGSVEVHSAGTDQGSTFKVRLPLMFDISPPTPVPETKSADAPAPKGRRVLVVDDNRPAAEMLSIMVKMLGNEVRTAHDGAEGVKAAGEFLPDVVLMDIGMPKMNGYEAAAYIKQQPWGKNMTLIALTGWGQEEDRRKSKEAGFDHHLVKPAEPAVLRSIFTDLPAGTESRVTKPK